MQREIADYNTAGSHKMLVTMATGIMYVIVGQIWIACPILFCTVIFTECGLV